jgi:hypothetical protein
VVEHLPSKDQALSLNFNTAKKLKIFPEIKKKNKKVKKPDLSAINIIYSKMYKQKLAVF